ncbi:BadF/BadG/BcrA/BcrD ATPase family protein [Paremcibacter congregatus]|uniref:ATPase BadF/BadG/BcrA/BcrD type domain-containing protein n=1 Tax=Paremcibacter congregatus TaxID=2043170 RepID=A0A2G4YQR6_9PROT|nr:BadF/BadG/BcrA/BcrD ATPase family protein [Paremcibacter congregatus]PHZ84674.1 hypothetical protein CRD36_10320 [Paremcibacter congregatus]QDE28869.1 hypothetical protein FIV45_17090 [Paremcibacter congregatus]
MMFYLGIDAGGSNCRARLVNSEGTVSGDGSAGPANIRRGISAAVSAIEEAFQKAAFDAGLNDVSLSEISAAIGIAGFSMTEMIDSLRQQLFFSNLKSVTFVSDGEIANLGAHGGRDGGTVSVGTGAIGIIKQGQKLTTLGGHGFPISDLGSGAYIGLNALKDTLRAADGLIPETGLTVEIFDIFDNNPRKAITFQDTMAAANYAEFTPIVISHAQKGDYIANKIMQKSARHVTELIMAIHRMDVPRISLTGGLGPVLLSWLDPEVKELLSAPLGSPLQGAIGLAKAHPVKIKR